MASQAIAVDLMTCLGNLAAAAASPVSPDALHGCVPPLALAVPTVLVHAVRKGTAAGQPRTYRLQPSPGCPTGGGGGDPSCATTLTRPAGTGAAAGKAAGTACATAAAASTATTSGRDAAAAAAAAGPSARGAPGRCSQGAAADAEPGGFACGCSRGCTGCTTTTCACTTRKKAAAWCSCSAC